MLVWLAVVLAPPRADAGPADADRRLLVGVLDVRVEGMPATVADDFERELEALAAIAPGERVWIGTRYRIREMLAGSTQWMEGCLLGPCMKELRKQTRAPVVLTVYLQNLGSTYRHVITVIRTDTGAVVDQRTEACGACTQAEAVTAATAAALDAVTAARGKLSTADDLATLQLRVIKPYRARLGTARRRTRTTALVLGGLAVVAGSFGFYWLAKADDDLAGPMLGIAGGLATAGIVSFAVAVTWD